MCEVVNNIPDVIGLVTTAVFNTKIKEVENKILIVSGLVKKTDYNARISDIKKKLFNTFDYNKFPSETLDVKVKEKELVDKSIFFNLVKNLINTKLKTLAIKAEQDKIVKMQTHDLSYFLGKYFFGNYGFQNMFIYQPTQYHRLKRR